MSAISDVVGELEQQFGRVEDELEELRMRFEDLKAEFGVDDSDISFDVDERRCDCECEKGGHK